MAVNLVSASNLKNWQLIASNTPTSGTTSTFSSLAGYNTYLLVFKLAFGSASNSWVTFNSDTTAGNYGSNSNLGSTYDGSNSRIILNGYANNTYTGYLLINGALESAPKLTEISGDYYVGIGKGVWRSTSAITSITVNAAQAFSASGNVIDLYGIAG